MIAFPGIRSNAAKFEMPVNTPMRGLVLLILIIIPTLSPANDKEKAASWIAKAAELSNLKGHGSKPFRLRLQWKSGYGTVIATGAYQLFWTSPEQWREELRIGDNVAIRVATGGKVWVERGDDFLSYPAYQLENMLAILWGLGSDDPGQVKQLFTQSIEGANSQCVKFERKDSWINQMCFGANGTLLAMSKAVSTNAMMDAERTGVIAGGTLKLGGPGLSASNTYNFMQYAQSGDKLFPRHMLVLSQKVPTVEVFVEDIQYTKPPDSVHESPVPDGASLTAVCTVDAAELGRRATLASIPSQFEAKLSRFIHFGGAARLYGIVGTDGNVRNETLISSESGLSGQSKDFGDIAAQIAQTMKYKPFMCAGAPQVFGTEEEIILRGTHAGPY
ncbi:MAG TPA: hypothetical protein VN310_19010 [Candidatus Dormibacteraeota bacterium]|nr:hypothetical protein [Candidatus Dormibacteraeota bacterium]